MTYYLSNYLCIIYGVLERLAVPSLLSQDSDLQKMSEGDKVFCNVSLLAYLIVFVQSISQLKGWVCSEQPISLRVCYWLSWTDCLCLAVRHKKVMAQLCMLSLCDNPSHAQHSWRVHSKSKADSNQQRKTKTTRYCILCRSSLKSTIEHN